MNPLYKNKLFSQRKLLLVIKIRLDNYRSFRQYKIHSQRILITVIAMLTKFVPNYAFIVMLETGFEPKPSTKTSSSCLEPTDPMLGWYRWDPVRIRYSGGRVRKGGVDVEIE